MSLNQFKLGRFTVTVTPMQGSAHPCYVVTLRGRRLGSQISYPSKADCERMENPPPPVPFWNGKFAVSRAGRPSNADKARRAAVEQQAMREGTGTHDVE